MFLVEARHVLSSIQRLGRVRVGGGFVASRGSGVSWLLKQSQRLEGPAKLLEGLGRRLKRPRKATGSWEEGVLGYLILRAT